MSDKKEDDLSLEEIKLRKEEQKEEFEVLESIYGEDNKYTCLDENHFQYKFGEDGEPDAFVLSINWSPAYPCKEPEFHLDSFYNKLTPQAFKLSLLEAIRLESSRNVGMAQTYTMIEWIRENLDTLVANAKLEQQAKKPAPIPEADKVEETDTCTGASADHESSGVTKKKPSSGLTKSQKRREWDKKDSKGETARGADWVDIVKHLSKTGGQADDDDT